MPYKLEPGIAPLPYAKLLEIEILEASKEGIKGKLKVRPKCARLATSCTLLALSINGECLTLVARSKVVSSWFGA